MARRLVSGRGGRQHGRLDGAAVDGEKVPRFTVKRTLSPVGGMKEKSASTSDEVSVAVGVALLRGVRVQAVLSALLPPKRRNPGPTCAIMRCRV